MDNQNKNLILAVALSMMVIIGWSILFPPPEQPVDATAPAGATQATVGTTPSADATTGTAAGTTAGTAAGQAAPTPDQAIAALANSERVQIDTPSLEGSISLYGGRIDELRLKNYRETVDKDSDIVTLFAPQGGEGAYYTLYGWAPAAGVTADQLPGATTMWELESGQTLTQDSPIKLKWDNGNGLVFHRTIAIDDKFMFQITQSVENTGSTTVGLAPYGIIARHGIPVDMKKFFILHEGVIALHDGELAEIDYDDIEDYAINPDEGAQAEVMRSAEGGWIGFTDHYWMSTLIPGNGAVKEVVKYDSRRNLFQTETVSPTQTLAPGTSAQVETRLFAGAKEWATIKHYQDEEGVTNFIDSIDWGWFFFLTKPIFAVLHWLHGIIGNMGWAIIALTFFLKALVLPLAYKSYASMAKMRELQPQMEKLKEEAGDDRQKMQQGMMALYKREKVNPASGCLPILLQIPIFFSLYKVIFVTLELRHAPWFGWINDLSAPDPSSILNLFGLLPFDAPDPGSMLSFISLGILPILLGISMWLQQKLNVAPTDPVQKQIMAWMPWVFMFMLGSFASGLVLYWITNNTITFLQQYAIMRSHGYKPDVLGNITSSFKRKPKDAAK
ncbi:membrane protein insertase YidC [Rhodalgimonas zhirmunskyi]|uniref:Membrane protein insertase YidC n=1 Tax=Rhodalgimonas zhirmunskyi TaxID=2964767 RepID=A0AAJ1X6V6_9RHOB|nr:membrane protein insertase YidC [Rhodoalgimonas zhirmunskyi]MDQ2095599.1 membrane protein insertase YidC [Rhodoalgimonas zhirmunskyi]